MRESIQIFPHSFHFTLRDRCQIANKTKKQRFMLFYLDFCRVCYFFFCSLFAPSLLCSFFFLVTYFLLYFIGRWRCRHYEHSLNIHNHLTKTFTKHLQYIWPLHNATSIERFSVYILFLSFFYFFHFIFLSYACTVRFISFVLTEIHCICIKFALFSLHTSCLLNFVSPAVTPVVFPSWPCLERSLRVENRTNANRKSQH